ncbi:hypothetical protein QCA50_006005 [Cerrena zonata]|uniref:SUN domain-containing protein n=1 Tax=Cerrena zonata TaxID=2478898 RepID=A0AAW0GL03_9APHY
MSFSSTPLGQGRRLDHRTFLNKKPSSSASTTTTQRSRSPPLKRQVPTSYAYGGPTASSRSPPKPTSSNNPLDDSDPPALVRFARLKQQQTTGASPHPEKWAVKDTSVQIASAFYQAASTSVEETSSSMQSHPNEAWASGTTRSHVPRSTSVEYEKETHTTVTRRLAPPPPRRPLAKTNSFNREVPDSEGEEEQHSRSRVEREKSPLAPLFETARSIVRSAEYFLRPPEDTSATNGHSQPNTSSSYDYSQEEQDYQQTKSAMKHRKNRMSTDNKAYRPSMSDLDESDEDFDEDGKRSRRKKLKKGTGGAGPPLTSLPVAGYDKRRRKRKGQKSNGDEESSDDDGVSQVSRSADQHSVRGVTPQARDPSVQPPSRMSVPRGTAPPQDRSYNTSGHNDTYDVEQALHMESIAEADESLPTPDLSYDDEKPIKAPFSLGATLGRTVHGFFSLIWRILDLLVLRPLSLVLRTNFKLLARYLSIALALYAIWYALRSGYAPSLPSLPSFSRPAPYRPPSLPPQDVSELSDRLQRLENALATLAADNQRSKTYIEADTRSQADITGRLGALENRIIKESTRVVDMESKIRASASQGLQSVKQEVDLLKAQWQSKPQIASDEEAREKLRLLEERVGSVEGGVKEAIELGKTKVETKPGTWWKGSLSSSPSTVTIKSTDGQDVSSLINQLVDNAVSTFSKDNLAKPDFALYSSGGRVIPSLTSETLELRPQGLFSQVVGVLTGDGYAVGKPPVTALHHEIHDGHCWPFEGSVGQLGVSLSAPVFVSEVSIDHVPREVASDVRSAPREMEIWGLVEGQENLEKVKEWLERKEVLRKEEAEVFGEPLDGPTAGNEELPPASLPQSPPYIRLANFTYDIHASKHVQTFPVRQEIAELGIDFGVVVLLVKSNWGRDEFTCLYRVRVHGQRLMPIPEPWSPPVEEDAGFAVITPVFWFYFSSSIYSTTHAYAHAFLMHFPYAIKRPHEPKRSRNERNEPHRPFSPRLFF